MPYQKTSELPDTVKKLPAKAKEMYLAAFNAAYEKFEGEDGREAHAHAVAWTAVERKYTKEGGKWVARESLQTEDITEDGPGNFGHGGLEGQVGGSSPSGGGKAFANRKASEKWANKEFAGTEFSGLEEKAIGKYVGDYYVNEVARSGKISADAKPIIDNLDNAIAKCAMPESVAVYRGVSDGVFPDAPPPMTGGTFADKGYVSTSFDKGTAEGFAKMGNAGVIMDITVPKGTNALPVSITKHGYRNEAELLLPRGSSFRITNDVIRDGKRHISAEVM